MILQRRGAACAVLLLACPGLPLFAQPAARGGPKTARAPFQAQSSSTIAYGAKDGEETVEITNVAYEVSGTNVPGRPPDERLVLRKTTRTKEVLGDMGIEATITLEAWPLGASLSQKPLYAIRLTGVDGRNMDNALLVFSRGTEEVDWWSVHQLGNGRHLFDTYVPLLRFSISRETLTLRYTGFEAPPDDTPDARLKEPHVVGVLTYASAERVIREALLTCDDPKQARILRSYADASRTASLVEGPVAGVKAKKAGEPSRAIRISFSRSYPSAPSPVTVLITIADDNLDLARAQLPPSMHVSAWQR
jgi:hypothetical protein